MSDFIFNGMAHGSVASQLMQNGFDSRALRPWIGKDGRSYIAVTNAAGEQVARPTTNAALLRREDWKSIDQAVTRVALPRLRAVGDLRSSGLTYNIPNGMAKTVLETAAMSDINPATVSMDGLRMGDADRPAFALTNLPLPIIHKDFHYSLRQVMASRNGGSPLDTSTAELASRKVAEEAEKLLLGVSSVADQYAFGGGTVYGYTDFPQRNTKTITSPTLTAWTPQTLLAEVLAMKTQSQDDNFYGPWKIYASTGWDAYLDDDFNANYPNLTLRQRLRQIDGITDVMTLDYLQNYDLVMVQMTSDVVREVVGMDIRTVQWESAGGMQLNFKVMAIMVPQLRADYAGQCGLLHASV